MARTKFIGGPHDQETGDVDRILEIGDVSTCACHRAIYTVRSKRKGIFSFVFTALEEGAEYDEERNAQAVQDLRERPRSSSSILER